MIYKLLKKNVYVLILIFVLFSCNSNIENKTFNTSCYIIKNEKIEYNDLNEKNGKNYPIVANPEFFEIISEDSLNKTCTGGDIWAKDKATVFYKYFILQGANPKTFVLLSEGFSKDNKQVYFRENLLEKANNSKFEVLSDLYAKDNFNVYWTNKLISGIEDISTFESIDGYFAKDKTTLYYCKENTVTPVTFADFKTFKICENTDYSNFRYYTDINNAYLIEEGQDNLNQLITINDIKTAEFYQIGECYSKSGSAIYYKNKTLQNVDITTFQIFDKNYSKDKLKVFYQGFEIENADSKSFKINDNENFDAIDSSNTYIKGNRIINK